MVLKGNYLWVNDERGELVMKVKRLANRLYKILLNDCSPPCLLSKAEEMSWIWHLRLGHVNFEAMKMLENENMAREIPTFVHPKGVCNGCLLSKQT